MKCYICNKELTANLNDATHSKMHGEHIIPNAIAGHYISNRILCAQCGGGYSKDDSAFTSIFSNYITFLQESDKMRALDRNSNKQLPLQGDFFKNEDLSGIPSMCVQYKDGKIVPKTPFYEIDESSKKVSIYAERKTGEAYKRKVETDLRAQGKQVSGYVFEVVDDMSGLGYMGFYFTKGRPSFHDDLRKGIIKIATEFALDKGIKREDIPCVLDIDKATGKATPLHQDVLIIPYLPLDIVHSVYENERRNIEQYYPSHALRLFTETCTDGSKSLVCFVSLFSSFQFYVILNTDYKGDVVDTAYAQRILKRYTPTEEEVRQMDMSDLDLTIREYGLDREKMHASSLDCYTWIINELKLIGSEYDYFEQQEKDLDKVFTRIHNYMMNKVVGKELLQTGLEPSSITILDTIVGATDFNMADLMAVQRHCIDNHYFGRWYVMKNDGVLEIRSIPSECAFILENHPDLITQYNASNMTQINVYTSNLKKQNKA